VEFETPPDYFFETFAPLSFSARIRRRPFNRAVSVFRTASISIGAYVLCSVFERPMEFASLAASPIGPASPATASQLPNVACPSGAACHLDRRGSGDERSRVPKVLARRRRRSSSGIGWPLGATRSLASEGRLRPISPSAAKQCRSPPDLSSHDHRLADQTLGAPQA
jgi:hypothetical protein